MRVVIAGGHGQIARKLEELLTARGDEAVGLVRNLDHVPDLEAVGARAQVVDLESASTDEISQAVDGADAVVFAAGAGPDSGVDRKETVDRRAAARLADAAQHTSVPRYVMISAMGVEDADPDSDDVMQVYLRAKAAADADLRGRDLDWTIVRPGRLTDDEPTGKVSLGTALDRGSIPRGDVAAVLLAVLDSPLASRKQFDVILGKTDITQAVDSL